MEQEKNILPPSQQEGAKEEKYILRKEGSRSFLKNIAEIIEENLAIQVCEINRGRINALPRWAE